MGINTVRNVRSGRKGSRKELRVVIDSLFFLINRLIVCSIMTWTVVKNARSRADDRTWILVTV